MTDSQKSNSVSNMDITELFALLKSKLSPKKGYQAYGSGTYTPTPPRVSFIPIEVTERALERQAVKYSKYAAAAVCSGLIAAFLATSSSETKAEEQRSAMETSALASTVELNSFSPVTQLESETNSLLRTVDEATGGLANHGEVIDLFYSQVKGIGSLNTVTVNTFKPDDPSVGECGGTDPFNTKKLVACIEFSMETHKGSSGATEMINLLSQNPYFVDPMIPEIDERKEGATTLAGNVGVGLEYAIEYLGYTENLEEVVTK